MLVKAKSFRYYRGMSEKLRNFLRGMGTLNLFPRTNYEEFVPKKTSFDEEFKKHLQFAENCIIECMAQYEQETSYKEKTGE